MMSDTDILGEQGGRRATQATTEETLRLLARWLLHCHERARQRQQLGVLEPRLCDDIGVTRHEALEESRKPFWR